MPSSNLFQITEIMQLILLTNPGRMLDIGVGFGKYGFLSREYLELWDGREKYNERKRTIDGIEAFKDYLTPAHNFIYDNIFVGNAIEVLPSLKDGYDLVLLIDVLEHFGYEDGLKILQECRKRARNIIISVPLDIGGQKDAFGNPYETHRFQWEKSHFQQYPNTYFPSAAGSSFLVYMGEKAEDISRIQKAWNRKKAFLKVMDFLHLKEFAKRKFKLRPVDWRLNPGNLD